MSEKAQKYAYFAFIYFLPLLILALVFIFSQTGMTFAELANLAYENGSFVFRFIFLPYSAIYFIALLTYKLINYGVFILPIGIGSYLYSFITNGSFSMRDGTVFIGVIVFIFVILVSLNNAIGFIIYDKLVKKRIFGEQFQVSSRPKSKFDW